MPGDLHLAQQLARASVLRPKKQRRPHGHCLFMRSIMPGALHVEQQDGRGSPGCPNKALRKMSKSTEQSSSSPLFCISNSASPSRRPGAHNESASRYRNRKVHPQSEAVPGRELCDRCTRRPAEASTPAPRGRQTYPGVATGRSHVARTRAPAEEPQGGQPSMQQAGRRGADPWAIRSSSLGRAEPETPRWWAPTPHDASLHWSDGAMGRRLTGLNCT
eukprot:CAMPEP_0203947942 /NCGR_PEP_ID=MMETSP0359-20131031/82748_1 /ASSEMBLY_ACC=CAM_ASM_000338 /TAXON_ID=268821 /ORGANISM="Scrippsiella Hangoei, Strain SHTV-5" /LENGTH=217 /DNA_ID=CAMNT_0050879409 /DNA_START=238 /DNA_END=889 /DNA_ORIENTATION=-